MHRMSMTRSLLAAAFCALTGFASSAHAVGYNGGAGPLLDDPPITVGANWFATTATPPAFFFGGTGSFNSEGPFTFSSTGTVFVDVTDDFNTGDQFEVFDFGVSIGLTSLVAQSAGAEIGPDAAFINPLYSSGRFTLGPGAHSITIQAEQSPFGGGRAYLRVVATPEPATIGLLGAAIIGLGLRRRRANA